MPHPESSATRSIDVRWLYRLLRWTGKTSRIRAAWAVLRVVAAPLKGSR